MTDKLDKRIRECFTEMGEFDPEFQLFDIEETIDNLKALIQQAQIEELESLRRFAQTHNSVDTTSHAWDRSAALQSELEATE